MALIIIKCAVGGSVLQIIWAGLAAGRSLLLPQLQTLVCTWQDNEGKQFLQTNWKKIVHSGLYKQNAFTTIACRDSRTLRLSLYPKENRHLHYSWLILNLKKDQLYTFSSDRITCQGVQLNAIIRAVRKGNRGSKQNKMLSWEWSAWLAAITSKCQQ